jgi:type II restriction enzyme
MYLNFNTEIAQSYKSESQRIRVLTEDWVASNLYCPICGSPMLHHYEANRPVADFYCDKCNSDFELKSKESQNGVLGHKIADGAYDTMIQRITSMRNPNFFFLSYSNDEVNNFMLIPNHFFTPSIIEKRKPLAETARRAGWIGCNINIDAIPESGKIYLIKDSLELDHNKIIASYQRTEGLITHNLESRSWILDVLNCVEKIPDDSFSLSQVYEFEELLHSKHPENNFIKDKIRQQLQFLRDKGFIEFTTRGNYKKIH